MAEHGRPQPTPAASENEPLISLTVVAADANLVAVQVPYVSAIEVGMVLRAEPRRALIPAAQGGGAAMERDDLSPATCRQGDHLAVSRSGRLPVVRSADHEERSLGFSRLPGGPRPGQIGETMAPAQFRQHRGVQLKRSLKVANADVDM